jgi:hypothetical protein
LAIWKSDLYLGFAHQILPLSHNIRRYRIRSRNQGVR